MPERGNRCPCGTIIYIRNFISEIKEILFTAESRYANDPKRLLFRKTYGKIIVEFLLIKYDRHVFLVPKQQIQNWLLPSLLANAMPRVVEDMHD